MKELSPNNTEQFISFCNVLYEQLLTQKLLHPRKALLLSAATQDRLIKDECKKKLKRMLTEYGRGVFTFINNLGGFCKSQTLQLGSSYGTVNGFAIKEVDTLFGKTTNMIDDTQLESVLRICLANNLLFTRETKQGEKDKEWTVFYLTRETKQGEKDKEWTVFYLNRWICAAFSLPLGYGGWRKRTIRELTDWIKKEEKWEIGIRM